MKRPPTFVPPRPAQGSRRIPRSRTESAVELVRAEYEKARLRRELDQLSARTNTSHRAFQTHASRADMLISHLADNDDGL